MNITNQPLPIYNDISESYFANDCDYHNKTIVSPITHLPSFILKRTTSLDNNFTFEQINEDGTVCTSFTISTTPCISTIQEDSILYDLVTFDFPITNVNLCCGYKYIKITNGSNVWFTEYIRFKDFDANNSEHVKIEFRNSCNISGLKFPFKNCENFMFRLYLDELSGECCPTRESEFEVLVNNDSTEFNISASYEKNFNLKTYLLPHFLVDSLYTMVEMDEVNLYPKNTDIANYQFAKVEGLQINRIVEDVLCCFEQVEITFKREEDIITHACCGDIGELECINFASPYTNIVDAGSLPNQFIGSGVVYFINSNTGNVTNAWSNNVGDVATWDGSGWGFTSPTQRYVIVNGVYYELINGFYTEFSPINITNNGIGTGVLTMNINSNYFADLEISSNNINFTSLGTYTSAQLSNGINVSGSGIRYFRANIYNYNCDPITTFLTHGFSGN